MSTKLATNAQRCIRGMKNLLIYAKLRRKYGLYERFPNMRKMLKHFQEFNLDKYYGQIRQTIKLREAVAKSFTDGTLLESCFFLLKKHLRLLRQSPIFHKYCQDLMLRFHEDFSLEMEGLTPPEQQIETHIAFYSRMLRYKTLMRKYRVEDSNFEDFLGKFNLGIFVEMASRIFAEVDLVRKSLLKNYSLRNFEIENEIIMQENNRDRAVSDPPREKEYSTRKYFSRSSTKKPKPNQGLTKLKILRAADSKHKKNLIRADILSSGEKLGDIGLGKPKQSSNAEVKIYSETPRILDGLDLPKPQHHLRSQDLVDENYAQAELEIERQIQEKELLCVYFRVLRTTEETLNCSDCNLRVDFGFMAKIMNFLNRQVRRFCMQDSEVGVELLSVVLYNVFHFNKVFSRFLKRNSKNDRLERNFFMKYK